jgi:hypothetical protein
MSQDAKAANSNVHVIVPRGGPLALSIQVIGTDHMADGVTALSAVLGAYETAGYSDKYKLESANGMLYVVPERVLKSTGVLSNVESVLSSRISFPYQDRTAAETLQLILSNASAASGFKIGVGMVPLYTLLSQRALIGANNQPARDVLSLLFGRVSNANLAYQLYFEPRLKY